MCSMRTGLTFPLIGLITVHEGVVLGFAGEHQAQDGENCHRKPEINWIEHPWEEIFCQLL